MRTDVVFCIGRKHGTFAIVHKTAAGCAVRKPQRMSHFMNRNLGQALPRMLGITALFVTPKRRQDARSPVQGSES